MRCFRFPTRWRITDVPTGAHPLLRVCQQIYPFVCSHFNVSPYAPGYLGRVGSSAKAFGNIPERHLFPLVFFSSSQTLPFLSVSLFLEGACLTAHYRTVWVLPPSSKTFLLPSLMNYLHEKNVCPPSATNARTAAFA